MNKAQFKQQYPEAKGQFVSIEYSNGSYGVTIVYNWEFVEDRTKSEEDEEYIKTKQAFENFYGAKLEYGNVFLRKYSTKEVCNAIKAKIASIVPFASIVPSALGGSSIMILLSFQKPEQWANNIMENSPHIRYTIASDLKLEMFVYSRLPKEIKPRKAAIKPADSLEGLVDGIVKKLTEFIEKYNASKEAKQI